MSGIRPVDVLSEAGVPISTQPGPRGGCWLLDGYRTRLTGLTADEARALFMAGLSGASRRARPGHGAEGLPAATHVVEPLGLVLKAGVWYLVGRAPGRAEPHVYRLSQVVSATRLEQPFDRPAGFDLAGFWSRWSRAFEASRPRAQVVLRLAPEAVPAARAAAADPVPEDAEADGWVRATLVFERLDWAAGSILSLGAGAEVLEPAELRERVAAAAQAMVDRYRKLRA